MKDNYTGRHRFLSAPSQEVTRDDLARVSATGGTGSGVYSGTVLSYSSVSDEAVVQLDGGQAGTYLNFTGAALVAGNKVLVTSTDSSAVVMAKKA